MCRDMTAVGRLVKPLHSLTIILRLTLAGSVHDAAIVLGVGGFRVQQRGVPSRPRPPMRGKGLPFRLCAAVCCRWCLGVCRDASARDENKRTQSYAAYVPPPQGSPRFLMCLAVHSAIPNWKHTMILASRGGYILTPVWSESRPQASSDFPMLCVDWSCGEALPRSAGTIPKSVHLRTPQRRPCDAKRVRATRLR